MGRKSTRKELEQIVKELTGENVDTQNNRVRSSFLTEFNLIV